MGVLALTALAPSMAAPPAPATSSSLRPLVEELRSTAQASGLAGTDVSALFTADAAVGLTPALRARPNLRHALQVASTDPAVRVHTLGATLTGLRDADLDGLPDRATQALRQAVRTLNFCRSAGLGAPADDGDGELDLYLLPLDGAVANYAVLETAAPPGRGASGFGVVDSSARVDDAAFLGAVSRTVARLVLAGRDASAPLWWLEPSVLWLETQVAGPSPDAEHDLQVRWNHPERGLEVSDPILARGNVGLLWSLDDEGLERRVIGATWRALAERTDPQAAGATIASAVETTTGLDLAALLLRAAEYQIVTGRLPARWAAAVEQLPVLDQDLALPLAPLGAALLLIEPDAREPGGTRLFIAPVEEGAVGAVLSHQRGGLWDAVPLQCLAAAPCEVAIPWADYDRAVVVLLRGAGGAGGAVYRLHAERLGAADFIGFSSISARTLAPGFVEVAWSSAWESEDIFGWMVERAGGSEGPWAPISALPVPALGLPTEGSTYAVQDTLPIDAVRTFYRVVAVTRDGLRLTGPSVTVRAR